MAADTKIVLTAEDKTRAAFESAKRNLDGIGASISKVSGLMAGLGAGLSVAALTGFVRNTIDSAYALNDLSVRVGTSVQALASLQLAAKLADTDLDSLGKGLGKLSIYMAQNADEAARLGITAQDPVQAFAQLADALEQAQTPAERNAMANRVLGKSYVELMPLLAHGGAAIRQQAADSGEYAQGMAEMAEKAAKFNDALYKLSQRASAAGIALAGPLLDSLNIIIARFDAGEKAGRGFFASLYNAFGNEKLSTRAASLNKDLEEAVATLTRREAAAASGQQDNLGPLGKRLAESRLQDARDRVAALRKEIKQVQAEAGAILGGGEAKAEGAGKSGLLDSVLGTSETDKFQKAMQKAFDTKPLDDFLAGFQQKSKAISDEYRRLVADITGPGSEGAKGIDIASQISSGKQALASGDATGVDIAVSKAKEMLRGLKDNGGTTDDITYYARQLQELEQQALKSQETVARSAAEAMNKEILAVAARSEAMKFEVDTDYLGNQVREAIAKVMRDLQADPMRVPVVGETQIAGASGASRSVPISTLATKFGARK